MPQSQSRAAKERPNDIAALKSAPVSATIFQLARNHKAYAARLLRQLDLYPGQEILLMELAEVEQRSQAELVRTLMLDHSTVAKSLKRLQDAGLVTRRQSALDARSTIVSLTAAGRSLVERIDTAWNELERTTTSKLSPDQQRLFIQLAGQIARSVEEASTPR